MKGGSGLGASKTAEERSETPNIALHRPRLPSRFFPCSSPNLPSSIPPLTPDPLFGILRGPFWPVLGPRSLSRKIHASELDGAQESPGDWGIWEVYFVEQGEVIVEEG